MGVSMTIDTAAGPHVGSTSAAWVDSRRDRTVDSARRAARAAESSARPAANVYRALDPDARESAMNGAITQMIRRGGPPDMARGTLERRERAMAAFARTPVKWRGAPCVNA